jgi:hypothetical protein
MDTKMIWDGTKSIAEQDDDVLDAMIAGLERERRDRNSAREAGDAATRLLASEAVGHIDFQLRVLRAEIERRAA